MCIGAFGWLYRASTCTDMCARSALPFSVSLPFVPANGSSCAP